MNRQLKYLFCRDVKNTLSLRNVFIWGCMSAICIFFFFTSSGRYDLVENGKLDFMTLMLPQIIFGAWAVLSVYFDLVSADREHNVLDCILCCGVKKNKLFLSKVLTSIIVAFVLSMIYPGICIVWSNNFNHCEVIKNSNDLELSQRTYFDAKIFYDYC